MVYLDDWLLCHQHHETLLDLTLQIIAFLVFGLGGQFGEVSDSLSEFRVSGSLLEVWMDTAYGGQSNQPFFYEILHFLLKFFL